MQGKPLPLVRPAYSTGAAGAVARGGAVHELSELRLEVVARKDSALLNEYIGATM